LQAWELIVRVSRNKKNQSQPHAAERAVNGKAYEEHCCLDFILY
jgi:hypothetical protein